MRNDNIVFIGMDTHKESTDISYVMNGRENSTQYPGKVTISPGRHK